MNDRLRWASTFHSLHAISTQFAPTCGSEGIEYVEASTFCMHCLKTPTGMSDFNSKHILFIILVSSLILCYLGLKFVCVGSKESKNLPEFLDQVYVCYCDYLMKVCFEWLFLFYLWFLESILRAWESYQLQNLRWSNFIDGTYLLRNRVEFVF